MFAGAARYRTAQRSTTTLRNDGGFRRDYLDVVILDTAGTYNDVVGFATELADRVVVITSTDLTSLKNTSLLVEHLALKGQGDERVVVTLIHGHDVDGSPQKADVEFAISRPVNHEIPFDANVRKASQSGVPVVQHYPRTAASLAFGRLAGDLAGFAYAPAESVEAVRGPSSKCRLCKTATAGRTGQDRSLGGAHLSSFTSPARPRNGFRGPRWFGELVGIALAGPRGCSRRLVGGLRVT